MGIFNFFKKNKGIEESKFYSEQFQAEICALALWKLEGNNFRQQEAEKELKKVGLNENQIEYILNKVINISNKREAINIQNTEFGISDELIDKIVKKEINENEIKGYFDKLFSFATYQAQQGKNKNALELFQKCLIINPNADEVYSNLSILNCNMNDYEQALSNINKAIGIKPTEKIYYKNKAVTCNDLELYQEEKTCYEKILEIDKNDFEARFSLSQLNIQDSDFEIALENLNKVINQTNNSEELFSPQLSKIGVLYELGFINEAESLYTKMTNLFPQEDFIHTIIPILLLHKNRKEEAIDFFDNQYSKTKKATILKAKADFFFEKDKTLAIKYYDEYLLINPKDVNAIQNKAILNSEIDENFDFNSQVEQILELDPNNVNALINKARKLASEKKYEEALKITEKIYSLDESNMDYFGFIIDILDLFKTDKEISSYIDKVKVKNPDKSYNLEYRKGLYYKLKQQYETAIEIFSSQNKIHEFAWNYYQIAITKNLQGKTEECLSYLQKTFELDNEIKEDAKNYFELENLFNNQKFIEIVK